MTTTLNMDAYRLDSGRFLLFIKCKEYNQKIRIV